MVPAATPVTDAEDVTSMNEKGTKAAAEPGPFSFSEPGHADAATTTAGAVTVQRAAGNKFIKVAWVHALSASTQQHAKILEVTIVVNCQQRQLHHCYVGSSHTAFTDVVADWQGDTCIILQDADSLSS